MGALALLGGEKVRKTPFASHPVLGDEERREVLEVLESGLLSGFTAKAGAAFLGGPKVRTLEEEFCEYFQVSYAVAVNSATAGLHTALAAAGIGPGDEVIVPPYTMSATATSVLMANAVPVFVDIEDVTYGLDPVKVEEAITEKTRAIIVVHLFGHAARIKEIMAIAEKYHLRVIEDCAQAPGATCEGQFVGTFGSAGVFSFNQHKTITTGEGGVVISNDKVITERMRLIRNHAENVIDDLPEIKDIANLVGWNYRMTELEAAVGIAQFRKLGKLTEHRIKLAEYLSSQINNLQSGITAAQAQSGCKHVYFILPMRFEESVVGIPRNDFVKAVVAEGVPVGGGYVKPLHMRRTYQEKTAFGEKGCPFTCAFYGKEISYKNLSLPVVENLYTRAMLLTTLCHYPLTKTDMDDIVTAFKKVLDRKNDLKT